MRSRGLEGLPPPPLSESPASDHFSSSPSGGAAALPKPCGISKMCARATPLDGKKTPAEGSVQCGPPAGRGQCGKAPSAQAQRPAQAQAQVGRRRGAGAGALSRQPALPDPAPPSALRTQRRVGAAEASCRWRVSAECRPAPLCRRRGSWAESAGRAG